MSALLKTLVAGTLQVGTNSAQGILSVYWNNSQLSPYGLLLFIITFLFGVCLLAVAALALAFRDASFFLLADSAAERSCFRRLPSGRLTLAQIMFGVAGVNALAAVTGWYATPASHTPPLIQAILQSVPIVTAIPLSVYVMKDKKNYLEWKPLLGMSLIIASIVVGIVPSLLDGTGTTGFSGYSTLGWCLVCVFSQIPTGAAMICQQAFLIRAGAHGANVTNLRRMKLIFRMILYQQVFVLVYVAAFFWVDLLPWFGFSDSLQSFQVGTSYSFECSFFGPGGVKSLPDGIHGPDACTPQTPIYAFSYILLYLVMLVCIAVLNVDSAVFNTVCFVLNTAAQAVFWLIPGTNPNPTSNPPIWAVVVALLCAITGISIFKAWEMQTPANEQFGFGIEYTQQAHLCLEDPLPIGGIIVGKGAVVTGRGNYVRLLDSHCDDEFNPPNSEIQMHAQGIN